uniref:Uncharacterized protein n=1 Tax=Hibiscus soymovirus TaxID=3023608 RepID=A0AAF0Z468_9VIRU|nr:hypothetical protein [Hibiscus soymovirus]
MKETSYKRGPYNKNYRNKYHSKKDTSGEDIQEMMKDLESFRKIINEKYEFSTYKSKIIENFQGLLDCLRKAEKRENKKLENRVKELEERIKELEKDPFSRILSDFNEICSSADNPQ